MSPITSARRAPRTTAFVWWIISSIVTGMVLEYPRTTIPRESPTSRMSTPASSRSMAVG